MSNFFVGLVAGFFLCVWALGVHPVTSAIALVDRIRQVEVSFAAETEQPPVAEQQAPPLQEGAF
jgi:hypothetical protein